MPNGKGPSQPTSRRWMDGIAASSAVTTVVMGGTVLLAWRLGLEPLKTFFPGQLAMPPNSALALLAGGLGLGLRQRRSWRIGFSLICLLVGLLTLFEYACGWNLGIDTLIAPGLPPTPQMALGLTLLGGALVLLERKHSDLLVLAALLIPITALAGYLFDASLLYQLSPEAGMPIHSALGLLILGIGLLCAKPQGWLMSPLSSAGPEGFLARRLLPISIAGPFFLGFLVQWGQNQGLYGGAHKLAILIVSSVAAFVFLEIASFQRLGKLDRQRKIQEDRFRKLYESAPDAMITIDSTGKILMVNEQAEKSFGYGRDELLGQTIELLVPERFRSRHVRHRSAFMDHPVARPVNSDLEPSARRKDGLEFPIEIFLVPFESEEGLLTAAFIRDITERKRAEDSLRALNKELEAFSYSVSHDLRAPLRSIDGFSLALLEDYHDELDETGKDFLGRIRDASQRMGHLIDDILKLSRITRAEMLSGPVDLSAMARRISLDLQQTQPERRVDWIIPEGVMAEGDERLLAVVLENLLGNAWKFTGKRELARIEFGSRQEGRETVYFVRDNGTGFDMTYVDKLFTAFQRLHTEEDFPGTGIGLATAKRVINRHGGRIWAESQADHGASFFFTLKGGTP